jgi:hypothetical protein
VFGALDSATSGFGDHKPPAVSSAHSLHRSTGIEVSGKFTSPLVAQNDPVPTVPMRMNVYVTAHLHGEVLVIGNATTKNPVATFQVSNPTTANNTWSAYVTFGDKQNGGCTFYLWAMAMPQWLERYLLAEGSSYEPNLQSSWMGRGLPPSPAAIMLDRITVQRSACQIRERCRC